MKITVIGGGSLLWAFGFARQFVGSRSLEDVTLVLMDLNAEALELVGTAAGMCNRRSGSPITIETTTDRDAALDGADFVVVSISTGGLAAMRHDIEIPQRYGIWHTVGDTVGPGGWSRALRNIPVFFDLAEGMSRLCPRAWLINVSNPLSVLTRVPQREFGIRSVGCCPGVDGHARTLARLAGFGPGARIDYVVTGIDHGSWFTSLHADGVDVIGELRGLGYCRSDGKLPSEVETADPLAEAASSRAVFAIWRETGFMPAINDRHAVENWPWFLARENERDIPFGLKRTSVDERAERYGARRRRLEEYIASDGEQEHGAGHGDDPVLQMIEALSGHGSFLSGANYMNVGQIPGLPEGAVVETRCRFDAAGVHPLTSPMPPLIKAMVLPQVLRQEAVIDIALSGGFDELAALVLTDPLCSRLEMGECRRMLREMLEANRRLIRNPELLESGA